MAMEEELLEFPCSYGVKAMGLATEDFADHVVELVSRHAEPPQPEDISVRSSSGDKYFSVTVTVQALSRYHLECIYGELKASERVLFLL